MEMKVEGVESGAMFRSTAMSFRAGQYVVWSYRSRIPRWHTILVDAEVVQDGLRRVRIRIHAPENRVLLRWVHPKNLLPKQAGEPDYPYRFW
jgi:hypothetical protein